MVLMRPGSRAAVPTIVPDEEARGCPVLHTCTKVEGAWRWRFAVVDGLACGMIGHAAEASPGPPDAAGL
jgi:hypothetical protein